MEPFRFRPSEELVQSEERELQVERQSIDPKIEYGVAELAD